MSKIGQQTTEYLLSFALVIGSLMMMQYYVKRRMQGVIKYRTDGFRKTIEGYNWQSPGHAWGSVPGETIRSGSSSDTNMQMDDVRSGDVEMTSDGWANSRITKPVGSGSSSSGGSTSSGGGSGPPLPPICEIDPCDPACCFVPPCPC